MTLTHIFLSGTWVPTNAGTLYLVSVSTYVLVQQNSYTRIP